MRTVLLPVYNNNQVSGFAKNDKVYIVKFLAPQSTIAKKARSIAYSSDVFSPAEKNLIKMRLKSMCLQKSNIEWQTSKSKNP